jgi:uncharacterized protein (TIGR00369 family)
MTMTKMLDVSRAIARGEAPPPPIAKLIGFDLVSVVPCESVVEFQATEAHANPMGTLHGGVLCDVADAAMGIAYSANLAEGESFTTLEHKINLLKPIWKARLRATDRVVKQGRTVGLVECDIIDENDNLVAHATSTCMTLRGEQAKGR